MESKEEIPFSSLAERLEEVIDPDEKYLDQRRKVIDILSNTKITFEDYAPYRFVNNDKKYTRNLIFENEKFNIMVLVWNSGKESPIHDHPCNGCWVRVLENSVQEVVYEKIEDGSLEVQTDTLYISGGVTWMHDIKGFHKIGNPNEDVAVTLHVYSPPYG